MAVRYLKVVLAAALLTGVGALGSSANRAQGETRILQVPLRVRIARCEDAAVRPESWTAEHVRAARKILSAYQIELEAAVDEFVPKKCELTTREDRHGLAAFVDSGDPTVLVVERVQDLDVPSYNLMGVHWRYRGAQEQYRGRHWIYLTARATPPVLAHELCHYFGLKHFMAGGNLMTPGPSDPSRRGTGPKPAPFKPVLVPWQVEKLRSEIRRQLLGPVEIL